MSIEQDVAEFVRRELRAPNLDLDTSLTTGNEATVFEDILEMVEKFSEVFNVDCLSINWRKYFPNTGIPFLPNAILPKFLKTDHHEPAPFTISMLIESAKAGRWLYD